VYIYRVFEYIVGIVYTWVSCFSMKTYSRGRHLRRASSRDRRRCDSILPSINNHNANKKINPRCIPRLIRNLYMVEKNICVFNVFCQSYLLRIYFVSIVKKKSKTVTTCKTYPRHTTVIIYI
jgi:hypothetical protein